MIKSLLQAVGDGKLRSIISLFTLREFDTSTEGGRSMERYRRSLVTSVATIGSKAVNFLMFTISIPLTISYLGKERFGLWMTMSSVILMFNIFSDLGLGTALLNKTSESRGQDRHDLIKVNVSGTFFTLVAVALFCVLAYLGLTMFLDYPALFKLTDVKSISEVNIAMWTLILIFSINLPFTVVDKFLEGSQKGYLSNLWQSAGNVISLAGIFLVVQMELGLAALVIVSFGIPTLIRVANFVYQFQFKNPWAKPELSDFQWSIVRALLSMGIVFFVLNIFNLLGVHSDNFIISGTMGASEVALYGIVQKLSMTALIFWSFTSSLWPAYTEALARQDFAWVRKTIRRSLLFSLISGLVIGLVIILAGNWAVTLLTKGMLTADLPLLLGFASYIFINGFISVFAVIFNSSYLFKQQMKYFIAASCVSLGLKLFLGPMYGVVGVIWATTIGYGLFYVVPGFFIVAKSFWSK